MRDIFLNGNVVTADGTPPPEPAAIERVCGNKFVRLGYTDRKGFFTFQLNQPIGALQDVSETVPDIYSRGALSSNPVQVDGQLSQTASTTSALFGCDLRAVLSGFQSTSVPITTIESVGPTNVGTIVLLRAEKHGSTVSATSLSAPKNARKAYEKAAGHLRKNKLNEAQAELEHAVQLYPRYAAAWTDLGSLYAKQNRLAQARTAFVQARAADESFAPPYIGLASVALRESKWAEAQEFSARAMELDGVDFPVSFYFNALANAKLGKLDQAEKSARTAEKLDTRHLLVDLKLLIGSILAAKGNYAEAAGELDSYLKRAPTAANAEKVRQRIAELNQLAASPQTSAALAPPDLPAAVAVNPSPVANRMDSDEIRTLAGSASAPLLASPQRWAPLDIDEDTPPLTPGIACPAEAVINGVSSRAKELMDNLQQFSASERIDHVTVDKSGNPGRSTSARFKYVAEIREARTGLDISEHRYGRESNSSFMAGMDVSGMAAHALMFHPILIENLTITCEGLGSVSGRPAWQLHFAERSDRPHRFRAVSARNTTYTMLLKGRLWASVDNYNVLRMETDLVQSIDAIALKKDHITIDYAPVDFRKHRSELWLPQNVDLYIDLLGQRTHRRHTFTDFELFSVDTAQQTTSPDAERAQNQTQP